MRILLIAIVLVVFATLVGCNNQSDVARTPIQQRPMLSPQPMPQVQPDSLTKPILLGEPTLKQIASDVSGKSITFKGEVWTFRNITGDDIEIVDVKRFGNDFVDVDVHLKVNTKVRTGLFRTTRQEVNACMRISYERSGNLWIVRNVTGLQCKPTR